MSQALALSINRTLTVCENSLDSYIQKVKNIPILSAEQEQQIAEHLQEHNDMESARQLVMSHLRFVMYIAKGYRGYGLPQADLIQEGNIGLMKAVKRFDPTMGVRLVSFAVHWIRAEIHEYILRNWRIVKIVTTKAQRKLFFNLRSSKKRLGWFSHEEIKTVADDLGVSYQDVLEMEKRLSMQDMTFDAPESGEDDDNFSPAAYLEDNRFDPALLVEQDNLQQYQLNLLYQGLSVLDERSRDILQHRWLNEQKATLQALAEKYAVSAERIRQIEKDALQKLRTGFAS
jgi:RNA polymerase sigma-32 factor